MTRETTNLAMIGCGLISAAHGIAAKRSSLPIQFTGCSSRSIDSANAFAVEYGCDNIFEDHHKLLASSGFDGVVIAAPPDVHKDIILDCIASGVRYILCEKPLTMTAVEARLVADAAQSSGATVLEAFMYRHHPQISKLQALLREGDLGPVDQFYSAVNMLDESETGGEKLPSNWRRDAIAGGGVTHDFLCYPIDAANLCANSEPRRVVARQFMSPTYGTVYRLFGLIEYDNGMVASVNASRLTDFSQPLKVSCARGSLTLPIAFNPIGDTVIYLQRSHSLIGTRTEKIPIEVETPISERLLDLQVFTTQLEHFVGLIDGTAEPAISLQESIRNAAVRDALIRSANDGVWVDVSVP